MRHRFSIFQSHLDLAHDYWSRLVQIGDTVIDATCGNGYDTLKLCQLALADEKGKVYAFDIQPTAVKATQDFLNVHLRLELKKRVVIYQQCHSTFLDSILTGSVKLIVYNLGYLPGGNKSKTTEEKTSIKSLCEACDLLQPGGAISLTCYPGHPEGFKEQQAILAYIAHLSPKQWSCCHHVWLNRKQSPSLLLIQKN